MSEPFVGEIRMFAGNFAPRGWAFCNGQLLAINQNDALFSLYGTIYGGDGRSTFGLPEMRGRIPIHAGTGPGLTPRREGSRGGSETVTLTTSEMPSHSHTLQALGNEATVQTPVNNLYAKIVLASGTEAPGYYGTANTSMNAGAVSNTGGSQHHENRMPSLCINYICALVGVYPSRS